MSKVLRPCAGSVGLELAAGRDGRSVAGQENGVHEVASWQPCPPLDGCIVVNMCAHISFALDQCPACDYIACTKVQLCSRPCLAKVITAN